jgi:hypothetical protein
VSHRRRSRTFFCSSELFAQCTDVVGVRVLSSAEDYCVSRQADWVTCRGPAPVACSNRPLLAGAAVSFGQPFELLQLLPHHDEISPRQQVPTQ